MGIGVNGAIAPSWSLLNMILPKLYVNKKKYQKKIGKDISLLRLLPLMAVAAMVVTVAVT